MCKTKGKRKERKLKRTSNGICSVCQLSPAAAEKLDIPVNYLGKWNKKMEEINK